MLSFNLKIVSPERELLNEEVGQISLMTPQGQITILPHHLPLVSQLVAGELIIKHVDNTTSVLAVSSGLVEILNNQVVILADTAERAEEIDATRAEEARQRAEQQLKDKNVESEEFAHFSALMEKEIVRLRVAKKHRHAGKNINLDKNLDEK